MAKKNNDNPKRGKAKNVASGAATGNAGGTFENRVQAAKLLSLALGIATPGIPNEKRVVELRFQARVHGNHTDDLVCTVEDSVGQKSKILMQMKRGLTARESDIKFEEAVGNAWLDYCNVDTFNRQTDALVIVYDSASSNDMRGAKAVTTVAKSSLNAHDFLQKLTEPGATNQLKRNALAAIRASVTLYNGNIPLADDEFFRFVKFLDFIAHDLDEEGTAEHAGYLTQIRQAALQCNIKENGVSVWSRLVTTCMNLNMVNGAVDFENLAVHVGGDLEVWFRAYREKLTQPFAVAASFQPYSPPVEPLFRPPANAQIEAPNANALFEERLPAARPNSQNALLSRQLDLINERIKACRYNEAKDDLKLMGQDLSALDGHQRARWYLMRGVCTWHLDESDTQAAADFIKAAEICDDDDKLAAARIRGLLLSNKVSEALHAGADAIERFPDSLSIWLVTANARLRNGEQLSLSDIPVQHRQQADALQMTAWSMYQAGNRSSAIQVALEAVVLPTVNFFTRNLLLMLVTEEVVSNPLTLAFRVIPAVDRQRLVTAVEAFEPHYEKLWAIQATKTLTHTVSNLALAHLFLGNPQQTLTLITDAQARGLKGDSFVRLELEARGALSPADAVTRGRALLSDMDAEALLAFGQIAAQLNDLSALQQALDTAAKLDSGNRPILDALHALRWDSLLRTGALEMALEELDQLDKATISSVPAAVVAARIFYRAKRSDDAEVLALKAQEILGDDGEPGDMSLVAGLLFHMRRYADAARIYEKILPSVTYSEIHTDLLCCYVRSGQRAKARRLINNFPSEWKNDHGARHLAIELGQSAGDWGLLDSLVGPQLAEAPAKAMSWLFKLMVDLHSHGRDIAASVAEIPDVLEGSVRDQTQLATAELTYGDKEKALRRLYRMRRTNLNSIEAASAYIGAHIAVTDDLPLLDVAVPSVAPGTSVVLEDATGARLTITIDPLECTSLPETTEFKSATSGEIVPLIGLKEGDEFTVQNFGGTRVLKVLAIQTAFRRLLTLAHDALHISITPSTTLTLLPLEPVAEGEAPKFEALNTQLRQSQNRARRTFELYTKMPITLGDTAKLLGRDVVSLLRFWPWAEVPLHVDGGSPKDRDDAAEVLKNHSGPILVNASTLTELALANCLESLAHLSKVYVVSQTQDIIEGRLAVARADRSTAVATRDGDQVIFFEISPEEHQREVQFLEKIARAINTYCTVVPSYGVEDPDVRLVQIQPVVSVEEYAAVLAAVEFSGIILTSDARLRAIAEYCGVRGIWPQVVLADQLARGVMSQHAYSISCLRMFSANRSFVSLRAEDLLILTYQGGAFFDQGMRRFIKHIASDDVEFESAARVTLEYLTLVAITGPCEFGALLELIQRLVEGLLRHGKCPEAFEERVYHYLNQKARVADWGFNCSGLIRAAVNLAKRASLRSPQDNPMLATVLFCSDPPYLRSGINEDDFELNSLRGSSASKVGTEPPAPSEVAATAGKEDDGSALVDLLQNPP